jgi:anthranilate synthase component 1
MVQPSLTVFREQARKGNAVPVYLDLAADCETPMGAYTKLRDADCDAFLFESIVGGEQISRYSFVGCSPRKVFAIGNETTQVRCKGGAVESFPTPTDPLECIQREMADYKVVEMRDGPPFSGGAVGFIGYEYIHRVEPTVRMPEADPVAMPILYFMLTDAVVIFDHVRQLLRICAYAHIDDAASPDDAYAKAMAEVERVRQRLRQPSNLEAVELGGAPVDDQIPEGNIPRAAFEGYVDQVKDYIRAGDVIQTVLSQRFESSFSGSAVDLYRALRTVNPSPYMTLMEGPDFAIIGASPELHVRLTGREVEIRPIAGTRHRGKDVAEDARLADDLLADEKERAEHLMLVDLARNDIGRVCAYGSVAVPTYMTIERYSHVMHIVSKVTGTLADECTAFDLMRATFPAGTLTGAPKVRAMQIISEIEGERRGVYGGAIGYFSYDGNHDSCIGIRTAVLKAGKLFIQSGAGIVADSVPASEFMETVNKARAMLKAVKLAEYFSGQATPTNRSGN